MEAAQQFEPHERVLMGSIRKRAVQIAERMEQLEQAENRTVEGTRA